MEHSEYGASVAKRIIHCPGSVNLCRNIIRKTTTYADEGTSAHNIGEYCLREGITAADFKDDIDVLTKIQPDHLKQYVNANMIAKVNMYLSVVYDCVRNTKNEAILHVEKSFNLNWVSEGMFGTNDACVIDKGRKITVFDLKYGSGVGVEVINNPQLLYYAAGAVGEKNEHEVEEVEIAIVQPNYDHPDGWARSQVISIDDLYNWVYTVLKPAVESAKCDDATLLPGGWCKDTFCPALGQCPALFEKTKELAKLDFANEVSQPKAPVNMTDDELAKVMDFKGLITKWLTEVETTLTNRLIEGKEVNGYKLVKKKGNRRWVDEEKTIQLLEMIYGDKVYAPKKIKSPAQMEKVVCDKSELNGLWEKPENGFSLAKDSDSRAVTSRKQAAIEDFI